MQSGHEASAADLCQLRELAAKAAVTCQANRQNPLQCQILRELCADISTQRITRGSKAALEIEQASGQLPSI